MQKTIQAKNSTKEEAEEIYHIWETSDVNTTESSSAEDEVWLIQPIKRHQLLYFYSTINIYLKRPKF